MKLFFVAALAFSFSETFAFASCPEIGAAPRTLTAPAADYASSKGFSLDSDGILVFDYGNRYGGAGKFRNPYFITNYANALYRDYLETNCSDTEVLKQFMLHADYLASSAVKRGKLAEWPYPFPIEDYGIAGGWISGIGQARIAGVLLRASALTSDEKYHELAEAAMETYAASPKDGGVSTIEDDVVWIEEYADPSGTSYKVLNGHITALGGVLDYYENTGEKKWKEIFDAGVNAVRRDIAKFDAGFLSFYSLYSPGGRKFAPRYGYNSLHVSQLLWLYEVVGDPLFLEWASRFQAYELADYSYSAKGSVDPVKHGPGGAAAHYGSAYWSHADFPTWLQVDVPENQYAGLAVHGNGDKAIPKDFTISAATDSGWVVLETVKGNTSKHYLAEFESINTTAFRVDIESDNGNRNVALQAVLPVPTEPTFAPVSDECNYRVGRAGGYNYDSALDGDPQTSMRVFCDGWLVLPSNAARSISVKGQSESAELMQLSVSDDLRQWSKVGEVGTNGETTPIPSSKFVRLDFTTKFSSIENVSIK